MFTSSRVVEEYQKKLQEKKTCTRTEASAILTSPSEWRIRTYTSPNLLAASRASFSSSFSAILSFASYLREMGGGEVGEFREGGREGESAREQEIERERGCERRGGGGGERERERESARERKGGREGGRG
jgi:hypothetical protein